MKTAFSWVVMVFFILIIRPSFLQAQDWNPFAPVFERLDSAQRIQFAEELDALQASWNFGNIKLTEVIDSLRRGLEVSQPTAGIDSMIFAWNAGRDSLGSILTRSDLPGSDQDFLLAEYDRIRSIWEGNLDHFRTAMEMYRDSLNNIDFAVVESAYENFTTLEEAWESNFETLKTSFEDALEQNKPAEKQPISKLLDALFGAGFQNLELAYGQEFGKFRYYQNLYSIDAHLVRVGSVPSYQQIWEARWYVQASWFTAPEQRGAEFPDALSGTNPLMYNGEFTLMFNPGLGNIGGASVRLVTSLGLEANTYVPAHRNPAIPATLSNVGKTTGWGPQVGAGFALNFQDISVYALGTLSQSEVVNSPGYRHTCSQAVAGVRYGNMVNLRYTIGESSWAPAGQKSANFNNVSLGLMFASLFH